MLKGMFERSQDIIVYTKNKSFIWTAYEDDLLKHNIVYNGKINCPIMSIDNEIIFGQEKDNKIVFRLNANRMNICDMDDFISDLQTIKFNKFT